MDVATIKGVIDRLTARGLTETSPDPEDGRRLLVSLTRARPATGRKGRAERARDIQGNAGAARCQGARDAGGAAEQAALKVIYLILTVIFSDTTGGVNG